MSCRKIVALEVHATRFGTKKRIWMARVESCFCAFMQVDFAETHKNLLNRMFYV